MLVDAHAVEAELLGVDELVEVTVVELMTEARVIQRVGHGDPGGALIARGELGIGHQVEREKAHRRITPSTTLTRLRRELGAGHATPRKLTEFPPRRC